MTPTSPPHGWVDAGPQIGASLPPEIAASPQTTTAVRERPTWVRYRVVTWLTAAAALAYLCRNSLGVMESTIRQELGLTKVQSGWFQGAFFPTYLLLQVPGAW